MPDKQVPESFIIVTLRKLIKSPAEGEEFYDKIRMEYLDQPEVSVYGQTSTHFKTIQE